MAACAEAGSNLSRYDGIRYGDHDKRHYETAAPNTNTNTNTVPLNPLERRISSARTLGFGTEVTRRVLAGTAVLSSDRFHTHYEGAARWRGVLTEYINAVFRGGGGEEKGDDDNADDDESSDAEGVDVMLVPTALSGPPPSSGSSSSSSYDATAAFANDVMIVPLSLGGFPAISIPVVVVDRDNENDDGIGGGDGRGVDKTTASTPSTNVVRLQIFGPRHADNVVLRVARILDEGMSSPSSSSL